MDLHRRPDEPQPRLAQVKDLIKRLRADLPAGSLVGGNSAAQVDFNHAITGSLWKIALWTLVATFILLLLMLRAVPLALQAVAANVLSVGASFGILTVVQTWGQPDGYIDSVTIPIILAVVFGLSMDYEVFLLSRIREHRDAGNDTRTAVIEGIATSGRTISAAALDHGRGLRLLRADRRARDHRARLRGCGGDRDRRDAGAVDPGAGGDGAVG